MSRALRWGAAAVALGLAGTVAAAFLIPPPPAPPGPEPGRSLYQAHCATCHGADGRGNVWRAWLLFLRPGNLADPQTAGLPDPYLIDIIRHGGANFGKPGMPSFGFVLREDEIRALVAYVRALPSTPRSPTLQGLRGPKPRELVSVQPDEDKPHGNQAGDPQERRPDRDRRASTHLPGRGRLTLRSAASPQRAGRPRGDGSCGGPREAAALRGSTTT